MLHCLFRNVIICQLRYIDYKYSELYKPDNIVYVCMVEERNMSDSMPSNHSQDTDDWRLNNFLIGDSV